jgi:hypothetical protein
MLQHAPHFMRLFRTQLELYLAPLVMLAGGRSRRGVGYSDQLPTPHCTNYIYMRGTMRLIYSTVGYLLLPTTK